jgi:two-component system cell cycle response regulator CpdR
MPRVVLLVEDEPLLCAVAALMLEDMGCNVVTADNGKNALEKLSTDLRIAILITDINVPDMDGYALAEAAVRMRKQLKVILLSGKESDGHGFPLVRKPFLKDDLIQTMARHTGLC